ncbi:MAG: hypothetical protein ACUVQX_00075 [Candidatus Bathycorpusculaceae bacterium]
MKKGKRKLKRNSRGQLLIVASLAIAILISSTTIYVYEVSRETNSNFIPTFSSLVLSSKQSAKNAVISALSNISNGNQKVILANNLDRLSQAFRSLNYFGICKLTFTLLNDSNYDSGVWLSWEAENIGISSAYVNFTFEIYGQTANVAANYVINVTTYIAVNGYCIQDSKEEKIVNLTCQVYDEEGPAKAVNISLFYEENGEWIQVNSSNRLAIRDFGNGTYTISFYIVTSSNFVKVSTHVWDLRGIFVLANTTCTKA